MISLRTSTGTGKSGEGFEGGIVVDGGGQGEGGAKNDEATN